MMRLRNTVASIVSQEYALCALKSKITRTSIAG
jgi:hypothetical protein